MENYITIFYLKDAPEGQRHFPIATKSDDSLDAREDAWKIAMKYIRQRKPEWLTAECLAVMTKEEFDNEYAQEQ